MRIRSIVACLGAVLVVASVGAAERGGLCPGVPYGAPYVYAPLDLYAGIPLAPAIPPPPDAPLAPPPVAPDGTSADTPRLRIQLPPGAANVYVDGEAIAAAPLSAAGVRLAPGQHRVEIILPGAQSIRLTLDVPPHATYPLHAPRPPETIDRALDAWRGGYHVVPPSGESTEPPSSGSGYHVIPSP